MELLRKAVRVDLQQDPIDLHYAFWSVKLPRKWVENTPGAKDFLSGTGSAAAIQVDRQETANLLDLFRAVGCLTVPRKTQYTLREVRDLFIPLCTSWHAQYYEHPLWAALRNGELSRNAVVAWVIHNYHLSRSAGVTAARCATRASRPDVRQLFLESALEEYSHCRDYYDVDEPRLGITREEAQQYVHLPASLAFDQQMLRIAEEDWLAHILVGYFQESTSSYYDQCSAFYHQVEEKYRLHGFFEGWKGHIRLDLDFGHASAFGDALDTDELLSSEHVEASYWNAAVTVQCLIDALDEILATDRRDDQIELRRPVTGERSSLVENALLKGTDPVVSSWRAEQVRVVSDLQAMIRMARVVRDASSVTSLSPTRVEFLSCELADACCRALSYARSHSEILALGRLVELSSTWMEKKATKRVWTVPDAAVAAVANCLRESAITPPYFVLLAIHAVSRLDEITDLDMWTDDTQARRELNLLGKMYTVDGHAFGSLATQVVLFDELWARLAHTETHDVEVDVFS